MSKILADITPMLIVWARTTAWLNTMQLAKAMWRKEEEIIKREKWELLPTIPQARKLADVCKRPLASLYLVTPPTDFQVLKNFRSLNQHNNYTFSIELTDIINKTAYRQENIKSILIDEWATELDFIGLHTIKDNPKDVATSIQNIFNFSYDEYLKTAKEKVFKTWMNKIEEFNIFIFRDTQIELSECRWFTIIDDYAPFIFINSNDSSNWQLFSLLHEVAHILINQSDIINSDNHTTTNETIEQFCNKVAAEVLVDKKALMKYINTINIPIESKIRKASSHFKVSEEVIARALLDNNTISQNTYLKLRDEYQKRWQEIQKKKKEKMKDNTSWPDYYIKKISNNWYSYTNTVLNAYVKGNILATDLSNLLNLKVNHLKKMREKLKSIYITN